ncbi:hypothetical protein WMY93_019888 [Mugilogobius chulae]|uniref:Uncharacterized protein n=1 Tax=Mugilogobius chulae TaxID=88201 RepID=A0AAW0NQU4_9GOBI
MGCSTSSQTSTVEPARPGSKREESNGASTTGAANENGNVAEDSVTLPDQTPVVAEEGKPDETVPAAEAAPEETPPAAEETHLPQRSLSPQRPALLQRRRQRQQQQPKLLRKLQQRVKQQLRPPQPPQQKNQLPNQKKQKPQNLQQQSPAQRRHQLPASEARQMNDFLMRD